MQGRGGEVFQRDFTQRKELLGDIERGSKINRRLFLTEKQSRNISRNKKGKGRN